MSKKIFNEQEILELSKNKYVMNLSYNLLLNMKLEKLQG